MFLDKKIAFICEPSLTKTIDEKTYQNARHQYKGLKRDMKYIPDHRIGQ